MITRYGNDDNEKLSTSVVEKLDREMILLTHTWDEFEKTTFRGTIFSNLKQIFTSQILEIKAARDAVAGMSNGSFDILAGVIIGEHGTDLDANALEQYGYPVEEEENTDGTE